MIKFHVGNKTFSTTGIRIEREKIPILWNMDIPKSIPDPSNVRDASPTAVVIAVFFAMGDSKVIYMHTAYTVSSTPAVSRIIPEAIRLLDKRPHEANPAVKSEATLSRSGVT
jgi:hypothetical protein